uniref:Uncharacterized protein n=1 Tax=Arsenophonus endosymbiont of Trialeurodes vaporariorum TaxID=235567 RepID=A0A3B0LZ41_9GAMM
MIKKPNEKIIRHSASERINHWLVVIFFYLRQLVD